MKRTSEQRVNNTGQGGIGKHRKHIATSHISDFELLFCTILLSTISAGTVCTCVCPADYDYMRPPQKVSDADETLVPAFSMHVDQRLIIVYTPETHIFNGIRNRLIEKAQH